MADAATQTARVIRRMERFRARAIRDVASAQKHLADQMLTKLKWRTSRAFQTVPSYLHDPLSRRRFKKGTVPFFSMRARSIGRTPWVGQAQFYALGPHILNMELATSQYYQHEVVGTDIGYPMGLERGKGRYILWVYFGTVKMQPRPFLHIILRGNRNVYMQRMRGAMNRAIRAA